MNRVFLIFSYALVTVLLAAAQLLAIALWPDCEDGKSCKDRRSSARLMVDILHEVAPALQKHEPRFEALRERPSLSHGATAPAAQGRRCVSDLLVLIGGKLGGFTSSPSAIEDVLRRMSLDTVGAARDAVGDLLTRPQTHDAIVNQSAECIAGNPMLAQMACVLLEGGEVQVTLLVDPGEALRASLHLFLVLERLGATARDDPKLYGLLIRHFSRVGEETIVARMPEFVRRTGKDESYAAFLKQKWRSVLTPSQWDAAQRLAVGGQPAQAAVNWMLAVNILEAASVDLSRGVLDNVDLAMALAVESTWPPAHLDAQRRVSMDLEKDWLDTYIAWNANYLTLSNRLDNMAKLLVPSIACSAPGVAPVEGWVAPRPAGWLVARSVTLKAGLAYMVNLGLEQPALANDFEVSPQSRRALARFIARFSRLPAPAACCGETSLDGLWAFLKGYDPELNSPTSDFSGENFLLFSTLVGWVAVMLFGFGAELVAGESLLSHVGSASLKSNLWILAQLSFPLLLYASLRAESAVGLLLLALGLWKMGFPEGHGYLLNSIMDGHFVARTADFLNGLGTLLHHAATSLTVTGVNTGLFPGSRPLLVACLVPVVQHLFSPVRYHAQRAYIIGELALEAWFQWEVVANIGAFATMHGLQIDRIGRACAIAMLMAHWMYILAAALDLVAGCVAPLAPTKGKDEEEEGDGELPATAPGSPEQWIATSPSRRSLRRTSLERMHDAVCQPAVARTTSAGSFRAKAVEGPVMIVDRDGSAMGASSVQPFQSESVVSV